jgi:hypothetical protein
LHPKKVAEQGFNKPANLQTLEKVIKTLGAEGLGAVQNPNGA